MNCVNCGQENPERALICYWCGLNPRTGEHPYPALTMPDVRDPSGLYVSEVELPPAIEVPAPMPVSGLSVGMVEAPDLSTLVMPDLPAIEIAPPPNIPDLVQFATVRRRARHRPVVRVAPAPPVTTRPVLPGWGRVLVFGVGLGLLFVLGAALVAAVGAASFGSAFCLLGLLGLVAALWGGLLLARVGRRVVERAGVAYDRLEVLGRALREVAPGMVQEIPVNLPKRMGVLDLPVAYSELRWLAGREGEPTLEMAVDLLTGAIADLVGRDDVVLARRTYPVEARGMLTRPTSAEVSRPVLTRRRAYAGPGELEERIARVLRTDQPVTVEDLVRGLVGPGGSRGGQQLVDRVKRAVSENPPDLDALASPEDALDELESFREAVRRADPELYELVEGEIRRGLGVAVRRAIPSSFLDLAQYGSAGADRSGQSGRRSDSQRRE